MTHAPSPFQTPQAALDDRGGGSSGGTRTRTRMDYMAAYKSFFANPRWGMSLLLLGVINIVPILGTLVSQGYGLGDNVRQHLYGEDTADEFTFDRFGEYLGHGVWLLVAGLLMMVPMIVLWVVVMIPASIIGSLGEVGQAIAGLLSLVLMLGAMFLFILLTQPLMLRVGLSQGLEGAFSVDFYRSFIGKMWLEIILSGLFLGLTYMVLATVAVLACFLPIFALVGLLSYAQMNLAIQVYELYLTRGGQPIEINSTFQSA